MMKENNITSKKTYKERQTQKGLYIHVPFCAMKCYYCDFLCYQNQEKRIHNYFGHLEKEIKAYKVKYGSLYFDTIFVGGGTPSHIDPSYLESIISCLRSNHQINMKGEITLEANPGDLTLDRLKRYMDMGFNRISIGVQSFQDRLLKEIGRNHQAERAKEAIKDTIDMGFNTSLDLIFAIPTQEFSEWRQDLEQAIQLGPNHISLYALILEPNTYMNRLVKENKLDRVPDDMDRLMYHWAIDRLKESGYHQYEISNFAREGGESIHNLKYWTMAEYIGMGLGASSFFRGKRYKNESTFKGYENSLTKGNLPIEECENIDLNRYKEDYIIMHMRRNKGINLNEYKDLFGIGFEQEYKHLVDKNLAFHILEKADDHIYFTRKGMDLSNAFFVEIIQ